MTEERFRPADDENRRTIATLAAVTEIRRLLDIPGKHERILVARERIAEIIDVAEAMADWLEDIAPHDPIAHSVLLRWRALEGTEERFRTDAEQRAIQRLRAAARALLRGWRWI